MKSADVWLTAELKESDSSLDFNELDESIRPYVKAAIADSNGRFQFDRLPGGNWAVVGCMLSQGSITALPKRVCLHTQVTIPEAGDKKVSLSG